MWIGVRNHDPQMLFQPLVLWKKERLTSAKYLLRSGSVVKRVERVHIGR